MRWSRKRQTPVQEAESLIVTHKKRLGLPKGETIKVARLMRGVRVANISLERKKEITAGLLKILSAHEAAAHDFFKFQEWAKSKNNGKMPRGLKRLKLETDWITRRS